MATSIPKAVPKSIPRAVAPAPAPEPPPLPEKKSRKKLFLVAGAALLLLAVGGGAWYAFENSADDKTAGADAQPQRATPPVFVVLEPFTVNLQPEAGEQYLQVAFTLQVGSQTEVDQIKLYMPQVRSRVLLMLSSKKASDLLTVEGKKKLADDIIGQIKQPFHPQGTPLEISNVFFTSFVIQ